MKVDEARRQTSRSSPRVQGASSPACSCRSRPTPMLADYLRQLDAIAVAHSRDASRRSPRRAAGRRRWRSPRRPRRPPAAPATPSADARRRPTAAAAAPARRRRRRSPTGFTAIPFSLDGRRDVRQRPGVPAATCRTGRRVCSSSTRHRPARRRRTAAGRRRQAGDCPSATRSSSITRLRCTSCRDALAGRRSGGRPGTPAPPALPPARSRARTRWCRILTGR